MPVIHGLYAITPDNRDDNTLLTQVAQAADGGLRLLQYRNKTADNTSRLRQVEQLATLCYKRGICLIINDDVALAQQFNAGVHLGTNDTAVADARAQLGAAAIIGSSCQNNIARARQAAADGASYVAFGAMFATPSKSGTSHCPLSTLSAAKQVVALPLVAIGGITLDNAASVCAAGADAIAVINGLFAARDISATAAAYCRLFNHAH